MKAEDVRIGMKVRTAQGEVKTVRAIFPSCVILKGEREGRMYNELTCVR